jgi:ATP-binding cassette subfamily F protein 2
MEAVVWLEDYLAKWKKILLMVSHSQVRRCTSCHGFACVCVWRRVGKPVLTFAFRCGSRVCDAVQQDFLNNVCTHTVHLNNKKLTYYTGNYDQFVQTRSELEEEQMKRYQWEQDQIKQMKVRPGL